MPLAFKAFSQVAASAILGTAFPFLVANLDGEGLTMTWDILRPRRGPETGVVTIYNLSAARRQAIHAAWKAASAKRVPPGVVETRAGSYLLQAQGDVSVARLLAKRADPVLPYGYKLQFSIGWERVPTLVYRGDVIKMRPSKRQGQDVLTIMELGTQSVEDAAVGASFSEVRHVLIIEFLVKAPPPNGFGLQIEPASLAKIKERDAQLGIAKYDSWARAGSTSTIVTDLLLLLDLEWKIHNGRFIVTEKGNAATASLDAFVLSPQTGLLEWAEVDDGGVELMALGVPDLQSGHQISALDTHGKPIGATRHRVESVRFTGTTEGRSLMAVEGRKAVLL